MHVTPKVLREKIEDKTISRADILQAIDSYNGLVYDRELTEGIAAAYNNYLILAAKAIGLSIRELNQLALENHPSKYTPGKYN